VIRQSKTIEDWAYRDFARVTQKPKIIIGLRAPQENRRRGPVGRINHKRASTLLLETVEYI